MIVPKQPFTGIDESIERVIIAVGVVLAHHENGHHEGCLAVLSRGGKCDCGYVTALTELAKETRTLRLRALERAAKKRGKKATP